MSTATDGTASVFKRVIVGAVVLAVGVTIVGQVAGVGALTTPDGSIRLGADDAVLLSGTDSVNSVADSTGRAADLSGGSVDITGGLGIVDDADGNWTFATYAAVDNSSQSSTLWSIDDNYVVGYLPNNGGQYFLWYYNASSTNSYATTIAAGSPGSLSTVMVERDGDTLTLFNESDASTTITVNPSSETSAALPASDNLDGRLDETRTWDRPLTATERSNYRSDGIQPVAVGNRSARLLFDTTGNSVAVEFRGASGELRGAATRGSGLAGTTLAEGTDYAIKRVGGEDAVVPVAGGDLENQPRLVVDTPLGEFEKAALALGSAFALAGLLVVVVVAARVLRVVKTT
jgi:hypothetical protein